MATIALPVRRRPRRWGLWVLGAGGCVLTALAALYAVALYRVTVGDQRGISLTAAWPMVSPDSLAAAAVVAADPGGNANAAPIVVQLAAEWQRQENRLEPGLLAAVWPSRAGDVVVVLNPAFYAPDSPYGYTTPSTRLARIERLAATWQLVLATSGRPWPAETGDPAPGVIVIRRDYDPAQGTPVVSVVADTRDLQPTLRGVRTP